jgi:acyl-CoA synthetase (AMP-forming)/AMP-acid ligase II
MTPPAGLREPVATIPALLAERGAPGDVALESVDAPAASYTALRQATDALAAALRHAGIDPGVRVALVSPNSAAMVTAFLGIAAAGTCAPLNPAYARAELEFYLGDLEPALLMVDAVLDTPAREVARSRGIPIIELEQAAGAPSGTVTLDGRILSDGPLASPRPDDVALVLHTSGTTSRPKMVPLTHRNLATSARHVAATLALSPRDRAITIMPLFHIHGLVAGLLAPFSAGGTVIVPPGFLASEFAGWLARFRPTWYTAVPTMHQAILQRLTTPEGRALRAQAPLRFVRSSSAALAPRTIRDIEALLEVPVIEAYGMTEAAHQMTSNPLPPATRRPGSVGTAAGPAIAIMTSDGTLLPPGEIGEVVIRGANVTSGYLANAEANTAAFTAGWFRTGDQGQLDTDGYLTLTGRLKELINRAGEKVAPLEVDAILADHPAVAQAICFGIPHPILGEEVAAAVVLKPGSNVTPRALREFVAARLAYFKVPRQLRIVDRIPVGATGKLQRRGLAEQLGVTAEVPVIAGDVTPPRTPIEEIVAATCAEVLRREIPGVHENFFALGGDSMLATRAVARLRTLLRVDISILAFFDAPTVAGIAAEIDFLIAATP